MHIAQLSLAAAFCAVLWWMYHSHHRKTQTGRAKLLDDCVSLLQNPVLSLNEAGYAKLEGNFQGCRMRVMLEEDHMTMRKIPSLWLHVVAEAHRPIKGSLDILVRPQNTEFYSPSWDWNGKVQPLPDWPNHATYRTQDVPPDLPALDAHVRVFFRDDKAKELLVTPKAVRLTYQAKQAERGEYLLLRAANFDHESLPSSMLQAMLDCASAINRDLQGVTNNDKPH
ncbi:MAG: hypothetical protein ACKVN9_05050 [Methylophilaceae bacterium]